MMTPDPNDPLASMWEAAGAKVAGLNVVGMWNFSHGMFHPPVSAAVGSGMGINPSVTTLVAEECQEQRPQGRPGTTWVVHYGHSNCGGDTLK